VQPSIKVSQYGLLIGQMTERPLLSHGSFTHSLTHSLGALSHIHAKPEVNASTVVLFLFFSSRKPHT
jgi:hypothetical protein